MSKSDSPISIKLNSSNYHGWSKKMENFLATKKMKRFILNDSFENYYLLSNFKSDFEIAYDQKRILIDAIIDANDRRFAVSEIEKLYHNDLSQWSGNKAKISKGLD